MSDEPTPQEPQTPPVDIPPAPTPNPLDHRFTPEDAPYPWAVGRSTREVLQLVQQMNNAMQTGAPAPQIQQPQYMPQHVVPQPQAPPPVNQPDIELAIKDPEEYNRQLAAYLEASNRRTQEAVLAEVQQLAGPLMRNNAMMARNNVKNDPEYARVFDRYGPEIDLVLQENQVPLQNRTIEAFQMAADIVRGRHYKELAREEAQQFVVASSGSGTVAATTSAVGAPPSGDALDRLWETNHDYVVSAKGNRLTKEDIRKAIKVQGHTPESFVKLLDNNDMFIAPDGKHIRMRGRTDG